MPCCVIGPGLVGSFLGAAANAPWVISRHGRPVHEQVLLPRGMRCWQPRQIASPTAPALVATRVHQTNWAHLPVHSLAAQNGLGQPIPVVVCFMAIDRLADGCITSIGVPPRLVVGPLAPCWRPVLEAWSAAGITVQEVADPQPAQFEKAILNATVGPLCLATGLTMAQIWADPTWRALALEATREGVLIAKDRGVRIEPGIAERACRFFSQVGTHVPSIVRDPGELPSILGYLLGCAVSPAPALEHIASLLATSNAVSR